MLHLIKLAVGARDLGALRAFQAHRAIHDPPLRHQTRSRPVRAPEIVGGGSIFWVVAGTILVRQRILAIEDDRWDDGSRCAGLILDLALVPVRPRPQKAFQGWRYLAADAAPPDLTAADVATGLDALPAPLLRELRLLGLI